MGCTTSTSAAEAAFKKGGVAGAADFNNRLRIGQVLGLPAQHDKNIGSYPNMDDLEGGWFTTNGHIAVVDIRESEEERSELIADNTIIHIPWHKEDVTVDENFEGKATMVEFKSNDDRVVIKSGGAKGAVKLDLEAGQAEAEIAANLSSSMGKGHGSIDFSFTVPLVRLGLKKRAEPGSQQRHIDTVVIGGRVQGTILMTGGQAKRGLGASAMCRLGSAGSSGGANVGGSSERTGGVYDYKVEAKAGPELKFQFNGKTIDEVINYLQTDWAKALRRSPHLWKPLFVKASHLTEARCVNLLVVGETGDGKSTLINALRAPGQEAAESGDHNIRGITKEITAYRGKPLMNLDLTLFDTPGVGDRDVPVTQLIAQIEARVQSHGTEFHGVLVTAKLTDSRVSLGAQIVRELIQRGVLNDDRWSKVILVGTKFDRSTKREIDLFREDVARDFFSQMAGAAENQAGEDNRGMVAVTGKRGNQHDYSELVAHIAMLGSEPIKYRAPPEKEFAEAMAVRLGLQRETFERDLKEAREKAEEALKRAISAENRLRSQQTTNMMMGLLAPMMGGLYGLGPRSRTPRREIKDEAPEDAADAAAPQAAEVTSDEERKEAMEGSSEEEGRDSEPRKLPKQPENVDAGSQGSDSTTVGQKASQGSDSTTTGQSPTPSDGERAPEDSSRV